MSLAKQRLKTKVKLLKRDFYGSVEVDFEMNAVVLARRCGVWGVLIVWGLP